MYSYTARHRRFSVGGNELLRFSSSLPVFSSYPNITSFYEELSKNCEEWCESYLFSRIRDEKNKTDRGLPQTALFPFGNRKLYIGGIRLHILDGNSCRGKADGCHIYRQRADMANKHGDTCSAKIRPARYFKGARHKRRRGALASVADGKNTLALTNRERVK